MDWPDVNKEKGIRGYRARHRKVEKPGLRET